MSGLSPSPAEIEALQQMLNGNTPLPVSIDAHLKQKQLDLMAIVADRTPIYLDTRFLVNLRKTSENNFSESDSSGLLVSLRRAVSNGKAFCPISASTFKELLKHHDLGVRMRTAALVDELSLGISLINLEELIKAEVTWFLALKINSKVCSQAFPLWTRLSHSLGSFLPSVSGLTNNGNLALEVAVFNKIWSSKLTDICSHLPPYAYDLSSFAARLNEDCNRHANEVKDFKTVYASEIQGLSDFYADVAVEWMRHQLNGLGTNTIIPSDAGATWQNVFANVMTLGKAQNALRCLHIIASIHAIFRLDAKRKFKKNDLLDIQHAAAGVGYCSAMFTERSLSSSLRQKPLTLDSLYRCMITSDVQQAVNYVESLG